MAACSAALDEGDGRSPPNDTTAAFCTTILDTLVESCTSTFVTQSARGLYDIARTPTLPLLFPLFPQRNH